MASEKKHHLFDGLLRGPGTLNHADAPLANAWHFNQAGAGLLNDRERLQPKVRDNAFLVSWAWTQLY